MPELPSIAHVALSVTDLAASTAWYEQLLGVEPAMTLSDGPFERKVFALAAGHRISRRRAWASS